MGEHSAEKDTPARCDEHYDRHPDLPHLVAVCALPAGHAGEHSNVLPKPLAGLLGSVLPPAKPAPDLAQRPEAGR